MIVILLLFHKFVIRCNFRSNAEFTILNLRAAQPFDDRPTQKCPKGDTALRLALVADPPNKLFIEIFNCIPCFNLLYYDETKVAM